MTFVTLFPRGGTVKILTPRGDQTLPPHPEDLHHELSHHLPEGWRLASGAQTRLLWLLEPNLPPIWENYDWTRHHLDGQPFSRFTVVVREARWPDSLLPPARHFHYHDAFPPEEHDFCSGFQTFIKSARLHRLPQRLKNLSASEQGEWFFLAHGDTEGLVGVNPVLLDHPPQTVWLLACDQGGAMRRLAKKLLERGARTVVYACGALSAPEIEALVHHRLTHAGMRPETVLTRLPPDLLSRSASLEIMGELELDDSPVREYNLATWRRETHNQASYLHFRDDRDNWIQLKEAWEHRHFWPRTIEHLELKARLLWLAEQYDHDWMLNFLNQNPDMATPRGLRQRAKAMRRLGNYPAAAAYLKQAFGQAEDNVDRYELHTLTLQIAIDLDLPQTAQDHLDQSESIRPPDLQIEENNKALDWRARILMRQGDWQRARRRLERKRRQALNSGGDGQRELAVLLAFGAWHDAAGGPVFEELDAWAREAMLMVKPGCTSPQGNDTDLYLCRALAYHRWARRRPVEGWLLQTLRAGCDHSDPGPAAQGLLVCALHQPVKESDVDQAFEALEDGVYYLEAAVFAALLNDTHRRERYWRKFRSVRDQAVESFPEWRQEAEARSARETTALDAEENARCHRIVSTGILPL